MENKNPTAQAQALLLRRYQAEAERAELKLEITKLALEAARQAAASRSKTEGA